MCLYLIPLVSCLEKVQTRSLYCSGQHVNERKYSGVLKSIKVRHQLDNFLKTYYFLQNWI